jgi:CYTH domain-containing protein
MSLSRHFLIASSLARLLSREQPGPRVAEGYFPQTSGRTLYVCIEDDTGSLVLADAPPGVSGEAVAELPLAQAEALLEAAAGQVGYGRTTLRLHSQVMQLCRFISPGALDVLAVVFGNEAEAQQFQPPAWLGPEVSTDPAYQNLSIALQGVPPVPDVELSDAALNALLDGLESRPSAAPRQDAALVAQEVEPSASAEKGEPSDLGLEDNVIRELARSLRSWRK